MKILGIESSCDETAAAVVEDGRRLLSNVVSSQIDIHAEYGGVVPEVAARSHIEAINPVIHRALSEANCTWDDIDAIAVTYAPGLVGSLLVGTLAARTLAFLKKKPLYAIHHVEAHVYANFVTRQGGAHPSALLRNEFEATAPPPEAQLTPRANAVEPLATSSEETSTAQVSSDVTASGSATSISVVSDPKATAALEITSLSRESLGAKGGSETTELRLPNHQPPFPMLALIVSGGHTQLVLFRDHGDYDLLGQTRDDAVGEAFDKVAKIIGLPYPGGPSIAKAAESGNPNKYQFPKSRLENPYDFSFSGLKTAVLRAVQAEVGVDYCFPSHELPARLDDVQRADFAASFQKTAVETLADKTLHAVKDFSPASVVIAGGVAASQALRKELSNRLPLPIEYAPMELCTDNAAMIATLGYFYAQRMPAVDPFELEVIPSISMRETAWANSSSA